MLIPITIAQCDFCGEQIMDDDTTRKVFETRNKLAESAPTGLTPVGTTYRAS